MLVLSTANLDEALRGYATKYDCSSADINPIGSFSKKDVQKIIKYGIKEFGLYSLIDVRNAKPSSELVPLKCGKVV